MTSSPQIVLGTINSLPLGTAEQEIERVYQERLRPFIKVLYRFPRLKTVLYYSGSLLAWIEKHHSEFIDVLAEMVKRRQIELLGGGYYEPIFSLISKTDSIGQTEFLTTFLRKTFGSRPRGCWIPEMIWEPDYPSMFRSAGLEYTFLSEQQFMEAGYELADLFFPTLTEDQGKTLLVFPILDRLSCKFLHVSPEEIERQILSAYPEHLKRESDPVMTLLWDGTDQAPDLGAAGLEDWMEDLFTRLANHQAQGRLTTRQAHRISRLGTPRSRGYFPPTSYATLLDRMHISEEVKQRYLEMPMPGVGRTGLYYSGMFRQSLVRYPEAAQLYGKMQFINSLVNQVRGDRYRKQAAKEELWKGQTHTPLWHGPRGGVYQSRFRKSSYSALISAELLTREQGIFAPSIISTDLDLDGQEEFLYQGNDLNAYVHARGGSLFELDYLVNPWNYQDSFSRYPEPYHGITMDDPVYDGWSRRSFIDHFFSPDQVFSEEAGFSERGTHWAQPYMLQDKTTEVAKVFHLDLLTEGLVENDEGIQCAVELRKVYSFEKGKVSVRYCIRNTGTIRLETLFAPECNFSFPSTKVPDLRTYRVNGSPIKDEIGHLKMDLDGVHGLLFEDFWNRVSLKLEHDQAVRLWLFPVYTTHNWKNVCHQVYQSTCVQFRIPLGLDPGQEWNGSFQVRFGRLK